MGSLFNFSTLITPRVMKFLFVAGVIVNALLTLGVISAGFNYGAGIGFVALVFSVPLFFIGVISSRVFCECILVMFMIRSELAHMRQNLTPASLNSNP
jgi:hypothetical protein